MPVRRVRAARRDPPRARSESVETVVIGRALMHGRLQPVEIGIDDEGRILKVARSIPGGRRRDFGEAILLPSAVDLHVHFRDPGGDPDVESLASGTLQAAYGGVALVCDMPNTEPPVDSPDRVEEKQARARGRLAVDLLIVAGVSAAVDPNDLALSAGAFKLYLSPSTGIEELPDPATLPGLLSAVARTGLALAVHAEDPARFGDLSTPQNTAEWNAARPPEAEHEAIARLLPKTPPNLRLHVAHVTDTLSARLLREAGHSFEVTPHHLLLSASSSEGAFQKTNPPIRDDETRQGLSEEFRAGRVPAVASDHAPHSGESKERPFPLAPSGVPGVETMLPLLLENVRHGELALGVLQAAASDRPARWLGVPLGRLVAGHRADLVVVDFRDRTTVEAKHLHAPAGWTPFEGFPAVFPRHHLRAGVPIVQDGEYVGARIGAVVRPDYAR